MHQNLLLEERSLDEYEKYYIGLMAISRHKSAVLLEEFIENFKTYMGPEEWLYGLQNASPKIKALHKVNVILAHRPWMLDGSHIEELVHAGLTIRQCVNALILIPYFHTMASMLHALGIESVADTQPMFGYKKDPDESATEENPKVIQGLLRKMADIVSHNYDPHTGKLSGDTEDPYSVDLCTPTVPAQGSLELHCDTSDKTEDNKYPQFSVFSPIMNFTYGDFYRRGYKSQAKTLKYDVSIWYPI